MNLEQIDKLLDTEVPDDMVQAKNLGNKLDSFRYAAYREMVLKEKELTEQKNRFQMIKGPKTTESDRKFYTEFHTRDAKEAYDLAYGRYDNINRKINWIQTSVKAETEMFKRS